MFFVTKKIFIVAKIYFLKTISKLYKIKPKETEKMISIKNYYRTF